LFKQGPLWEIVECIAVGGRRLIEEFAEMIGPSIEDVLAVREQSLPILAA